MRVVVVGGTGRVGAQVVAQLAAVGHEVVAAAPSTGVDAVAGTGLSVLDGARVVVDVSNSPSFADEDVFAFFRASTTNVLAAAAGVGHVVVLSVVGADRLPGSGYLRAKVEQERLVRESGLPHTIVRATQFFEFLGGIAQAGADGDVVRLTPAKFQPIAAKDVVSAVVDAAVGAPLNDIREIAGPEVFGIDELVRSVETREVVTDPAAGYFGAPVGERDLLPGPDAVIYKTRFESWRQEA